MPRVLIFSPVTGQRKSFKAQVNANTVRTGRASLPDFHAMVQEPMTARIAEKFVPSLILPSRQRAAS